MTFRVRLFVLTVALVSLMAGTAIAIALELPPGGTFVDDDGNIHEGNIEAIRAEGITKGCNPPVNDRYCPDAGVTRGQMAAFLVRALDPPPTAEDYFTDDDGSVFETDINRLAAAGITKGCDPPVNDRYCPDGSVTRGQMAAFLARGFGYTDSGSGDLFTDDDTSIFEADIDRLGTAGVTKGCNPPANDRYCPDDVVRRDQMASFLARALGLAPIVPLPPPPPLNPEVFAIGDSVMEGVVVWAPRLADSMPNTTVDAKCCRAFSSADDVLAEWLSRGHDPDVVVVHLGSNGPPRASQFDDVMRVAGSERRVLFLTVRLNKTWESSTNSAIRSNTNRFANAELVDWWALADPHPEWFSTDINCGCHLWTTTVRSAYVGLIKDAVQDQ
ncbi:MAG: S-layer homology domain-containing protein [Actinomycetota bacterium]|nr:S-layer homology domain-containing protein [Actinomycetota bacterium]